MSFRTILATEKANIKGQVSGKDLLLHHPCLEGKGREDNREGGAGREELRGEGDTDTERKGSFLNLNTP